MKVGIAQQYHLLTEEEKWKIRLQSHVLIDIDQITTENLPALLNGNTPIALYISDYQENHQLLIESLIEERDSLIVVGDKVFDDDVFSDAWLPQIPLQKVETIQLDTLNNSEGSLIVAAAKELLALKILNQESINDSIFIAYWNQLGKMPNFIQIDHELFHIADSLALMLNKKNKVFGAVRSKEGLLYGVSFKNHKNLVVDGYFSLPIDIKENLPVFIPHKAGYYFSPDIIYTTPENRNNLKEFIGFPLDFEYGLTDHFAFGTTIKNSIRKNNKELIINAVRIQVDEVHGKVGYFSKGAYVDAGLDSRTALKGSFAISAWVKPTVLSNNNSILGKGDNFVLKLHEGLLTFTMADIKDYISEASPVPINEWTHVALVHSKLNNELLFFVNGVQTDKIQLIEDYDTSDYNILIGSNLWQEFFVGFLTNIKIWERELNAFEIAKEYHRIEMNSPTELSLYGIIGIVAAAVFLMVMTIWLWRRRAAKTRVTSIRKENRKVGVNSDFKRSDEASEKILCFGPLRIITSEGKDIAKKLSPKLKQLFVIVLLHSLGDKDGINTKKLTEALWPGVGLKNAKNTRGTNIQNLRAILSLTKEMNLTFRDKNWYLEIGEDCFCDYQEVLNYLNDLGRNDMSVAHLEEHLPKLFTILKEDRFFVNMSDSWLDPIVEKMSNRIIEFCYEISKRLDMDKHSSLLYDLASVMYIYDDLNENALQIKLQILIGQGKLSLAHTVYDNFSRLYEKIYGEMYTVKFEDMVVGNTP
ncbi:hypothetical protein DHD05_09140 [Arenibacter sp. N53]|uniref:LamG domain-containing protein n=1 Tax=Arenibacter TaxID=178469 RepID=UPI000CD48B5A|nr:MULTISPECIES: LamG-like jellyroll fold domain-containing protein [Arenibacter]MCM4151754.1 hypothetical protein [Arenibacter sp. N53]